MQKKEQRNIILDSIEIEDNYFEGRACQYNVKDSYGTTFVPGCFSRGGLDDKQYSLLWNHDYNRPVGTFKAEEREDGLYIMGRWDDNTAGRDARASALSGSASDLSVGFTWIIESEADAKDEIIRTARLQEVSQVTSRFGAVPGSQLTAVRNQESETIEEETEERWTTVYPSKDNAGPQNTVPEATESILTPSEPVGDISHGEEKEETQESSDQVDEVSLSETAEPAVNTSEDESTLEASVPEETPEETPEEVAAEDTDSKSKPKKKKVNKSIIALNDYIQSLF